jgi:hypothetical protein
MSHEYKMCQKNVHSKKSTNVQCVYTIYRNYVYSMLTVEFIISVLVKLIKLKIFLVA